MPRGRRFFLSRMVWGWCIEVILLPMMNAAAKMNLFRNVKLSLYLSFITTLLIYIVIITHVEKCSNIRQKLISYEIESNKYIIKRRDISLRLSNIPFNVLFVINIQGFGGKQLIIEKTQQFNSKDFDIKTVQIDFNIKSNNQTIEMTHFAKF